MHTGFDFVTDELRNTQQLDGIAELLGKSDIERCNVGNPLGIHLLHSDRCPIGQRHQDRQLVGDAVGDVVLYGRGAGSLPTGSAVVGDLIAIARNFLKGAVGRVPPGSFQQDRRRPIRIRTMEEISSLYYLRFMVLDRPGVLSHIAGELGRCGISISSVLQQGRREGQTVPIVIKTHTATERDVQLALVAINRMAFISEPTTLIRVEGKDE